jgi:hypothetical protein
MSPMKHILALRTHRETVAQGTLQAQRKVWDRAVVDREAAADALADFTRMASAREASLTTALIGKTVHLREISDFNVTVADLRQQAQRLAQTLDQATQVRDQALHAVRECEVAHAVAWRAQQKFESFVNSEVSRVAHAREVQEDREIEEAGERPRPASGLEAYG